MAVDLPTSPNRPCQRDEELYGFNAGPDLRGCASSFTLSPATRHVSGEPGERARRQYPLATSRGRLRSAVRWRPACQLSTARRGAGRCQPLLAATHETPFGMCAVSGRLGRQLLSIATTSTCWPVVTASPNRIGPTQVTYRLLLAYAAKHAGVLPRHADLDACRYSVGKLPRGASDLSCSSPSNSLSPGVGPTALGGAW